MSTLDTFLDTTPKTTTLFTIGYSVRSMKQVVNLLINAGVEQVLDVRYNSYSKNPDFDGTSVNLPLRFEGYGFRYEHHPKLGNPLAWHEMFAKSRRAWKIQFFSRFTKAEWQAYRTIIGRMLTVLMCSEKDPRKCHRSELAFWFASDSKASLKIVHL